MTATHVNIHDREVISNCDILECLIVCLSIFISILYLHVYLGIIVCQKYCDRDLKRQMKTFLYANANMLLRRFSKCSIPVKC